MIERANRCNLALLASLATVVASAQTRGPIPYSPLTPAEIAEAERGVRQMFEEDKLTEEELAAEVEYFKRVDFFMSYTYRDDDFRSLFPEILETDERAYSCFIALTSPQSHTFAYLSTPDFERRDVRVKTLDCGLDSSGLFCELAESDALFLESPTEFFYVDASLDEDEGRTVATMYQDKFGSLGSVDRISKRADNYILRGGRDGCACRSERTARIRRFLFWSWLEVPETVTMQCS